MSYILDALKKSSEERQKLEPGNQLPQSIIPTQPVRTVTRNWRTTKIFIIVFSVLSCVAITGYWLYYFFLPPTIEPEITAKYSQQSNVTAAQSPLSAPPVPEQKIQVKTLPVINQPPAEKKARNGHVQTTPIPLLKNLSFAFQSSLPDMKYSGHVYSDNPARRMIMINAAVVREGDIISTDIELLKITKNGLIMNARGTKFRLELF